MGFIPEGMDMPHNPSNPLSTTKRYYGSSMGANCFQPIDLAVKRLVNRYNGFEAAYAANPNLCPGSGDHSLTFLLWTQLQAIVTAGVCPTASNVAYCAAVFGCPRTRISGVLPTAVYDTWIINQNRVLRQIYNGI